ncbi:DNA translocase FtsK, partial [Bosea sp. AAP35]|uniref:DNA translocase FtsK n=1 Tax=Bosea sp. AAP35 TaxID=1523417 RepID=UPI0032C10784
MPPQMDPSDGLTIEGEALAVVEDAYAVVEEPQTAIEPPVATTPLSLISDHAFWEVVSGDRSDEAQTALTEAGAHPREAEMPVAEPATRTVSQAPPAPFRPAVTPTVHRRTAPSPQASGRVTFRPAARALQPALAISRVAEPVEVPVPGRGVVVNRRARAEISAQSPEPAEDEAGQVPRIAPPAPFELPSITILAEPPVIETAIPTEVLQQNAGYLEGVLEDFNVRGEIVQACPGPVVTLYELEPAPGTKSSRVISLADDIARSMSAISARVAVIPGKNAIGIELPNARRETVFLRELLASQDFESSKHKLALGLGKTIGGEPVIVDLAKMPHLLVAGTTGSGKSVAINTMILSLLYRLTPQQCRLIMVDPKMLELSVYDGIPHLLTPVVTDPKKAVVALKWAVREMEERYKKMSKLSVRNIDGFNARVVEAAAAGEVITRTVQTGFDRHSGEAIYEDEV